MTAPRSTKQPTTLQALRRLDPFVRPVRRSIIIAMAMALAASLVSLAVPQVLQRIVDGPLRSKDAAQMPGAVAIIAVLGVIEAALYFARRLFIVGPGDRRRGEHAPRALREAAGPAGRVPRPVAERAAAVPLDERPQPDPPVHRLRLHLPGRERHHDRGRRRRAARS